MDHEQSSIMPGKPQWLVEMCSERKGPCVRCKHDNLDHIYMTLPTMDVMTFKYKKEYSFDEMEEIAEKYIAMCMWCHRMRRSIWRFRYRPIYFDKTKPCKGMLCDPENAIPGETEQVCHKCWDHYNTNDDQLAEKVNAIKREEKKCEMCEREIRKGNDIGFDYDHKDPWIKRGTISGMVHDLVPLKYIQREIDKCRLLCCHCHKDHTNTQQDLFQDEVFLYYRSRVMDLGWDDPLPPRPDPMKPDVEVMEFSSDEELPPGRYTYEQACEEIKKRRAALTPPPKPESPHDVEERKKQIKKHIRAMKRKFKADQRRVKKQKRG